MELSFTNLYSDIPKLEVLFKIGEFNAEDWALYELSFFQSGQEPLLRINQMLSRDCLELLYKRLNSILSEDSGSLEYEPIEPAFNLSLSRLNPEAVKILIIVDLGFVANKMATETGMGFQLHVNRKELKDNIRKIQQFRV